MAHTLTREELWELVWTEPVRTIAQRLGVSDVALKKRCVCANVPVPKRGYWTKLTAGKVVSRTALPPREPGASTKVQIGRPTYTYDLEAELAKPPPVAPVFLEPLAHVRARVERRLGRIKAVSDLDSPCAGVRQLMAEEAKRHAKAKTGEYLFSWEKPLFESAFEQRRLRLLNSIGAGLSRFGAQLSFGDKPARLITACVGDTRVELRLDHPSAKPNQRGEWTTREGATSTLRMQIGPERDRAEGYEAIWSDGNAVKLEARLTKIVLEIVVAGEAEYRHRSIRGHARSLEQRAEMEREDRRRREEADRRERDSRLAKEKARRDHLLGQAMAWRAAQDLRGFVAAVLSDSRQVAAQEEVQLWAEWALAEADAIDPVTSGNLSLAPNEP